MTFSVKLRPKIAKLLLKLPKRFFPDYRVVVNATLIDRNRRTLLDTQVSDFSSSSSSESSAAERRRCCRYCKRLYDSLEELDVEERTSSTPLSTVKLSWCEEVERELSHQNEIPTPPPMPSSFLTPKATPSGRRLTLDDIGSVKVWYYYRIQFQGKSVIFLAQTHTHKTAPNPRNTRLDGYSTEKICSPSFAIVS